MAATADRPRILVLLARNPKHNDLVDYTITKVWFTRDPRARSGKRRQHELKREGSFVCPEPLHDVRLVVEGLTASWTAPVRGGVPGTPGRERSGFENVPLPLDPRQEPPLGTTATTPA